MALFYDLHLASASAPDRVRALLTDSCTGSPEPRVGDVVGSPADDAVGVAPTRPLTAAMVADAYGFRPTVSAAVRLPKSASDDERREAPAVAAILAVLAHDPGDAFVKFLQDYPAFVRRRGAYVLDQRWAAARPWVWRLFPVGVEQAELVDPD